jgi:signal transduction histidine kinase/DNA-binding response OmpR family regulator
MIHQTNYVRGLAYQCAISTNSRRALIFMVKEGNYFLVDQYPFDTLTKPPPNLIKSISLSSGEHGFVNAEFSVLVPVMEGEDNIGAISLADKPGGYIKEDLTSLTPYLAIAQLILAKHQILSSYKRLCSDSTYKSKDLFLANMSHEIRTPLNGVVGYSQLLLGSEITHTQRGYLKNISHCSIQLMQIINDVLDFSKLSSGNMSLRKECFTFKEISDSVNGALGQRIKERQQVYTLFVDDSVPIFIVADKQKLTQIFVNILSNASKFTNPGGRIDVAVSASFNVLRVSISDTGVGISDMDQCRLFNTFMQIEESTYKSGTGLGLAISKRLCELLGGDISVKSTVGVGSIFTFTATFDQIDELSKDIKFDKELLKGKTVLLVDDNADNRIIISDILYRWEMEPIICASALEALRTIMSNRHELDIGLIDICMPGTTGTELAQQIKEERPFFPMIALSSVDSFINTTEFEATLEKPIHEVQLFNTIHTVLSKNQTPSAFIGSLEQLEASKPSSPPDKFNRDIRILVTDDIPYNRSLLVNILETLGYVNVDNASDGREAIQMIKDSLPGNPYQIILLDLRMPIVDGYGVIDAFRNHNWKLPKIIVVTASVLEHDREKCAFLGVRYFINKPIEIAQLRDVILRVSTNE